MHCCIKEPSAYPLTQDTISNPKGFSVFSVVFQHRIPKCISLILILCFEQTKVREYFSVLLRSKVVFVRFSESVSGSNFPSQSFTLQFPIIPICPRSSQFPVFYLIHRILCRGLEAAWSQVWQRKEVTGRQAFFFFVYSSSLSLLHF